MEIEAIYDHGRLELPKDIRLKHQRFKVRLEIPNEELAAEEEASEADAATSDAQGAEGPFIDRMRAILEPVRAQLEAGTNQPLSKEEQRELFYQEWEERHRGEH